MAKYLVKVNRIFLTDDISVTQGVIDSDNIEGVGDDRLKELCKLYPNDITPFKDGDITKPSEVADAKKATKRAPKVKDSAVQSAVDNIPAKKSK